MSAGLSLGAVCVYLGAVLDHRRRAGKNRGGHSNIAGFGFPVDRNGDRCIHIGVHIREAVRFVSQQPAYRPGEIRPEGRLPKISGVICRRHQGGKIPLPFPGGCQETDARALQNAVKLADVNGIENRQMENRAG